MPKNGSIELGCVKADQDGERAVARAAEKFGTMFGVSSGLLMPPSGPSLPSSTLAQMSSASAGRAWRARDNRRVRSDHGEKNGERCRDKGESVFGSQNLKDLAEHGAPPLHQCGVQVIPPRSSPTARDTGTAFGREGPFPNGSAHQRRRVSRMPLIAGIERRQNLQPPFAATEVMFGQATQSRGGG
jgi:hypothetical protein